MRPIMLRALGAFLTFMAIATSATAFDPSKYNSPRYNAPEVDKLTIQGSGSTGDLSRTFGRLSGSPGFATFERSISVSPAKFFSYGYIGDGGRHPLSSIKCLAGAYPTVPACADGVVTTGYTLAQWQALLPNGSVTALTNEIDEVAVASVINTAPAGAILDLPPGTLQLTKPLQSGCAPLQYQGRGREVTGIVQNTTGADIIQHGGLPGFCGVTYNATFKVSNLQLLCSVRCGTGIKANMSGPSATYVMDDVYVGPLDKTGNTQPQGPQSCAVITSGSLTSIDNVRCLGPLNQPLSGQLDGFVWNSGTGTAGGTGVYYVNLHNINVQFMRSCFAFNTTDTGSSFTGGIEGVEGSKLNCTQAMDGVTINNAAAASRGYYAPQYHFYQSQWDVYRYWMSTNGVHNVDFSGNLVYVQAPNAISGSFSKVSQGLFSNTYDVKIHDNKFNNDCTSGNVALHISSPPSATGTKVDIHDNLFEMSGPACAAGLILVDPGVSELREHHNLFTGTAQSPYVSNPSSGTASVQSEKYLKDLGASLNGDGSRTYSKSTVGATDGNGQISIAIPPGVFTSAPSVVASNGDVGASAALCMPTGTPTTTASTVKCFSLGSANPLGAGINVRINLVATGM